MLYLHKVQALWDNILSTNDAILYARYSALAAGASVSVVTPTSSALGFLPPVEVILAIDGEAEYRERGSG